MDDNKRWMCTVHIVIDQQLSIKPRHLTATTYSDSIGLVAGRDILGGGCDPTVGHRLFRGMRVLHGGGPDSVPHSDNDNSVGYRPIVHET